MSATEMPLKMCQWTNRVLLVFAPDASDPLFRRQRGMLMAAEHGLGERDMVLVFLAGGAASVTVEPVVPVAAVDLRASHGVPPDQFRVVLIGKDGGVKLHRGEPVPAADLFALIGAMPMRKQETRGRRG